MMNAPTALLTFSVILLLVHIFLQAYFVTKELGRAWNAGPRDENRNPQSVLAGRAERASCNFRETYPAFLALMLALSFQPANIMVAVIGGWVWILARIVYLPLYLAGIPYIRSFIWLVSLFGLFIMAVSFFI